MLGFIFSQFRRRAADYFKSRTVPKTATMLGFVAVFASVMVGLYELLSHGFAFIASNAYFGAAVSIYLYEMILLLVVALSIATALIEGVFRLFRNTKDLWIMASPGYQRLPTMVLGESVSGGAFLPLLILAIPTLAAMQHVYHIGILGIVLGLLAILLVVAASVLATLVIVFVVAKLLFVIGQLRLAPLLSIMVVLAVLAGFAAWQVVGTEGANILFPDMSSNSAAPSEQTTAIVAHFKYIPSHPAALVLYGAQEGNVPSMLAETLILALITAVLYGAYRLVSVWYLSLWQSLQAEPQPERPQGVAAIPMPFPRYLHGPLGALFEKEWLVIIRSGRDVMWLLFMLFLWLVQIGGDIVIKRSSGGAGIGTFPLFIQALEVGVIGYFLAAFALRFAFPTFSTERGTAWIVGASPLSLRHIYFGKLLFFCSFFGVLSIVVALLHSYLLGLSAGSAGGLVVLAFVIGVTITVFAVTLGVLFPDFETTDPQDLSTSLPGLAFVFSTVLYGGLGSWAFFQLLSLKELWPVLLFFSLSLLAAWLCMVLSLQKLKTFEFGVVS